MSVSKVVLAKLSPTMEDGKIVKWSKNEGDAVKIGDVLAEIETDKANMEMEALAEGVLRKVLVPAGQSAPVGSIIGVIAGADEDISAVLAEAEQKASAASAPEPAAEPEPEQEAAPEPESAAPAPAAAPAPVPVAPPAPAPPPRASEPGEAGRVRASPLARKLAAERNIPLSAVAGSGPGGRVVKRDVEGYSGAPVPAVGAAGGGSPAAPAPSVTPGEELPLSNMRRTIARRLAESKFSAPHFYVTVEVAMDAAMELREQLKASESVKVSVNDLILKACARALRAQPMVNASWADDRIITHGDVNLGVAVALPDGLITPVVRHADRKSVLEIAAEVRDLAERARSKRLRPDEYTGSTFTVSNLGMFDVSEFTAIINPPNSAILAVGSVRRVPVVEGDAVVVGQRMRLTLSSDHRVVDGALAAQFLAEVRALLETPIRIFV